MFKEKTVFILGAGASFPYGYPLGKELILEIIRCINSDEIYLPVPPRLPNNATVQDENFSCPEERNFVFDIFFPFYKEITSFEKPQENYTRGFSFEPKKNYTFGGNDYEEIGLSQLDSFLSLKNDLEYFDPVSIDSFLRDHPSHERAGKIMIAYCLLKCEDESKFKNKSIINKGECRTNNEVNTDNWYSYLINDILSGCQNPDDISENKLSIITFNYSEESNEEYKKLISDADQIIIIGFGFDRDNLNILGFPENKNGYEEFLKDKKLKYMDFGGQMDTIYQQFSEIQTAEYAQITRSISKSIISAYQNDFKLSLFQKN